jgi:hypothetical protein
MGAIGNRPAIWAVRNTGSAAVAGEEGGESNDTLK